jgi:serine/threonine-protein kinase
MFDLPSDLLVAQAIMDGAIRVPGELRPDVPAALDAVIRRALAPAPDRRFGSARELGDAVLDAIGGAVMPPGRIASALAPAMAGYLARRQTALDGLGLDRPPAQGSSRGAASGTDRTAGLPEIEVAVGAGSVVDAPTIAAVPAKPGRGRKLAMIAAILAVIAIAAGAAAWIGWAREPAVVAAPEPPVAPIAAVAVDAGAVAAHDAAAAPAPRVVAEPPPAAAAESPPAPRVVAEPGPRPGRRKAASGVSPRPPPPPPPPRAEDGPPGFLSVASTPFSTIWVDGKKIGDTPIYKLSLAPGPHRVRAVAGDRTKTFEVTVRSGEVATQRIDW